MNADISAMYILSYRGENATLKLAIKDQYFKTMTGAKEEILEKIKAGVRLGYVMIEKDFEIKTIEVFP